VAEMQLARDELDGGWASQGRVPESQKGPLAVG
jgi:hypothetical protein